MNGKTTICHTGSFLFLLLLLSGCHPPDDLVQVKETGFTQGTTYSITYYIEKPDPALAFGIDSIFHLINHTASVYDSNSIISLFNQNKPVPQNNHFLKLIKTSQDISEKTKGAFDITVGPLVQAWGFRKKEGKPVSDSLVTRLLQHTGYQKIQVSGDSVIKLDPAVQIDLNAIAQGYTVDLIALFLTDHGIHRFLVEIGGEIRAGDPKPEGQPWIVGIEKPALTDSSPQIVQERIALVNRSIVTSGNYRNYFKQEGHTYAHTINPLTGYPVSDGLLSATVIAATCIEADAYSTALMSMGVKQAEAFLHKYPGLQICLLYTEESGLVSLKFSTDFPPFLEKK